MSGKPCSSFGSSDAAETEEVLNGPSTSMNLKCSHIQETNTHTHTLSYPFSQLSAPFPWYQHYISQHLSISPPLSPQCLYLSPLHCHNTHTQTGAAGSLIGSYVFVTLSLWHLTFSRSFPKCHLIIFTPCTISPLSPLCFVLAVSIAFVFLLSQLLFFFPSCLYMHT